MTAGLYSRSEAQILAKQTRKTQAEHKVGGTDNQPMKSKKRTQAEIHRNTGEELKQTKGGSRT